jgi:hypothetical protein
MALSTGILKQAPSDELQRRRLRLQEDLARQSEIERQGQKRAKQLEVDNDLKVPAYREYLNRDISKYKKDVLSGQFSEAELNRRKAEILNRQAAMKSVDNIVDKAYEAYSLGKVKGVKDDVNSLNMLWLDPNSAIEGLDFTSVLKGGSSVAARISQPEADPMGFITNEGAKIAKAFLSSADPQYKKIATQDNRTFGEITRDLKQSNPEMLDALHKAILSNRRFREGLAIEKGSYEGIDDYYKEVYADMVPTRSNRQADASIPAPRNGEGGSEETFGLNLSVGESTIKKPLDKAIETGILGLKDVRLSGLAAVVPYDIEGIKNPDVKGRTFKGRISELTINDEGEPVAIVNPDRGSAKQVPYSQIKNDLINTAKAKSSKRVLNSLMSKINEYESKVGQATKIGLDKAALEKDLTDLTDIVISDDSKAEKDNQLKTRFPNLDIEFDDANKTDVIINGKPYKAYSSFFGFSKDAAEGESKKELINALYQAKNYSTAKEGEPSNEEDGTEGDIKVGNKRKSGGQTVIYNGSEYVKEGGESDITLYGKKIQEGINAFAKSKNITISEAMAKLRAAKRIN